ncbi:hypothetical protein BDZ89DRAFT_680008 [Hymenopellis radicata]|nr:hypothetical protein BDZ89DRAFT_680008 [Hymenopellis radicata]
MRSLLAPTLLGLYTGWSVSSQPHLRLSTPTPSWWRWNDSDRNVSMIQIRAPPHCRHSPSDSFRLRNPSRRILNPSPSPSRVLCAIIAANQALRHLAHIVARLYHFAVHVLASAPRPQVSESIPPSPVVAPIDCDAPCDAKEEPEHPLHLLPCSEIESHHTLRRLNDAPSSDHDAESPISPGRPTDFDSIDLPIILLQGSAQSLEEQSPILQCAATQLLHLVASQSTGLSSTTIPALLTRHSLGPLATPSNHEPAPTTAKNLDVLPSNSK